MYREQFRIPDGEQIRVTAQDGSTRAQSCRYIDDCHTEIGGSLYHICEYAEMLERSGAKASPLCAPPIRPTAGRDAR
jgi:hypothetical protein